MERVLIIGSNGAGKSTFSFELSEMTGLPLIHLDQIYWYDDWQVTPREEFEAIVLGEAKKCHWIIEGNNMKSLHQRLRYADTVFWFEFSPFICIFNILRREWKYRGKARPDMPETCISRLDFTFLNYAWNFNKKYRARIKELLEVADVEVFHFRKRSQVNKYIENMKTTITHNG